MGQNIRKLIMDAVAFAIALLFVFGFVLFLGVPFLPFFLDSSSSLIKIEPKDQIGHILTLIGFIFAILGLGGYIGWQQVQERKKEIDKGIEDLKKALVDFGAERIKVLSESKLAFAGLYQNYAKEKEKEELAKGIKDLYMRQAFQQVEEFEGLLPEDFRGSRQRGNLYQQQEQWAGAFEAFKKAEKLISLKHIERPYLLYNLALTCYRLKEPGHASAIVDWLLEAFQAIGELMSIALEDKNFTGIEPLRDFFGKLRDDGKAARDVTPSQKNDLAGC